MVNMVEQNSFTFRDDEGVVNHAYSWVSDAPTAAVQISHGVGEHALRYSRFAKFLAQNGYAVYANDHRGHGETGREQHLGDLTKLGKLGPGGLRATEKAMLDFAQIIRSKHRAIPLILFAHSWGSLMAQRIINRFDEFDAVVLSGSSYRLPGFMESGDLNKKHKHLGSTGFEWLSRDRNEVLKFQADELCFSADILKLFGLPDALRLFGVPNKNVPDVPMLVMSGTDDPIARKDSLERLTAAYKNSGVSDITLKLYMGGRHEMLNETNRETVFADVLKWLDSKASNKP